MYELWRLSKKFALLWRAYAVDKYYLELVISFGDRHYMDHYSNWRGGKRGLFTLDLLNTLRAPIVEFYACVQSGVMRFVFWLALVGAALPAVGTSPVTAAPAPHRWRRTRLLADCYPVSFCVTHGLMPAPDAALKKLAARVIAERKRAALTGDSGLPPIDEIGGQISEFPPPSWQGSSVSQQEEVAALAHSSASVGFEGGAGAKRWRAEWAAAHPRTAHGKADLARQKAAVAEQRVHDRWPSLLRRKIRPQNRFHRRVRLRK